MKVALYICLFLILIGILNTYILEYRIEFFGSLKLLYITIIFFAYIFLSILSLKYNLRKKINLFVKSSLIITHILYFLMVIIYYLVVLDGTTTYDLQITYSKLNKSEQIILMKDDYPINNSSYFEVYAYNLNQNIRLYKILDSVILNGVWIKNEYMSDKRDTINYKNFMYKSEYNN